MAQWQIDDITITQLIDSPAGSGARSIAGPGSRTLMANTRTEEPQ